MNFINNILNEYWKLNPFESIYQKRYEKKMFSGQ